jgi:hypothetical protein
MQTSHVFIASCKQRIQVRARWIKNKREVQPPGQHPQPGQASNTTHVVEHQKLMQQFRQFLEEEEEFWTQLVIRLHQSFTLNEATPALIKLGILSETEEVVNQPDGGPNWARNHFHFPPEDTSTSLVLATTADKECRLAIIVKAVVCIGDISRYCLLYFEGGDRPEAGQEDNVPAKRARTSPGGQSVADFSPRAKHINKAMHSYDQARRLMPHNGNPSHQMAIFIFHTKNTFQPLVYLYLALCVRQPYDTASENLGFVLTWALSHWYHRSTRGNPKDLASAARVKLLQDRIVVLHAIWRVGLKDIGVYVRLSVAFIHVHLTVEIAWIRYTDTNVQFIRNSLALFPPGPFPPL